MLRCTCYMGVSGRIFCGVRNGIEYQADITPTVELACSSDADRRQMLWRGRSAGICLPCSQRLRCRCTSCS